MSYEHSDTHAGGIVLRPSTSGPEFLIIRARRNPASWVLPKGHIEPGESSEAAAVREVEEEAGCHASIVAPLGRLQFGHVRTLFYLMRFEHEVESTEGRERFWGPVDEVHRLLTFEDTRRLLMRAHEIAVAGNEVR